MTAGNGAAEAANDGARANEIIARAQRLLSNGYLPIPVLGHDAPAEVVIGGKRRRQKPGKQPHALLWHDKERAVYGATPASVARWSQLRGIDACSNLGIACGTVVCVDIDVYDPDLAERIETLARRRLGPTQLCRVGQWPKRALVYRTAGEPLAKIQTPELRKDGRKAKVEVLGRGQQFVGFGTHPDTQAPYQWLDATPETLPASELLVVAEEQVRAFVAEAEALLRAEGYRTLAEIEAEQAQPESAKARNDGDPFRAVNQVALQNPDRWVPDLFGHGAYKDSRGVWRVPSSALGRDLEEDLSIAPGGIVDFGQHDQGDPRRGKRTTIDLVLEHGGAADATTAARWLAERLGKRLEDFGFEARKAKKRREPVEEPPGEADQRAVIQLAEERINAIARQCAWLLRDEVFLRGPVPAVLVRVEEVRTAREVEDGETEPGVIIDGVRHTRGSPILAEPTHARIQYRLDELALFEKLDRRSGRLRRKSCPSAIAARVIGAAAELRFRPCAGIVAVPLFRQGEVIAVPGYDWRTGTILELPDALPPLPERPSRPVARRALARLLRPFRGYINGKPPGDRKRLRCAFAAAVLTAILRPSLPAAPAILFDANVPGAGKGKAARAVAGIATGRHPSIVTEGHSDEETEKRLASAVLSGTSAILLDNLQRTLASSTLESGLTEGVATIRLFGKLVDVTVPCGALVLVTANNAAIRADMLRRTLPVRIVADTEEPEKRRFGFDPYEEARRDRLEIIAAGLTIAQAWWAVRETEEGRRIRETTLGSFEQWADLVAGAVEWLTGMNPVQLIEERKIEDPRLGNERAVIMALAAWQAQRTASSWWAAKDAVSDLEPEAWGDAFQARGERPNSRQVGHWLSARKDRVFGELQLIGQIDRKGVMQWTIRGVPGLSGSAGFPIASRARNGRLEDSNTDKLRGTSGGDPGKPSQTRQPGWEGEL